MIINSLPYECSGVDLRIQSWNRASLGLTKNSRAQIVHTLYHHSSTQHDFVISPFRREDWGDLWRFEIHLNDREGQIQEIVSNFDELGIVVLSSESRKTFDEDSSVKQFVINCRGYQSMVDGSSLERSTNPNADLSGLKDWMFLTFVKEVRYSEGVEPRIEIERNWPHLGLHQRLEAQSNSEQTNGASTLVGPEVVTFGERGSFRLPQSFLDLKQGFQPISRNRIYVSTNSRSKLVYLSAYQNSNVQHISLAIYFSEESRALAKIFETFRLRRELSLNVARHQLRQGVFGADAGTIWDKLGSQRIFTLNVLLETDRANLRSRDELYSLIEGDLHTEFSRSIIVEKRSAYPEGQEC